MNDHEGAGSRPGGEDAPETGEVDAPAGPDPDSGSTTEDDTSSDGPHPDDRIAELEMELRDRTDRIEELEDELAGARERTDELKDKLDDQEAEIEDLKSRLKRKQADFENYKKRAERKRERIQERATEDLVERLIEVRDDLRRGIENDHPDIESLRDGIEMTLRKFDRILDEENVAEIDPDPGTEVDPQRHEVVMQVDSENPEGTVADVYSPGYEMADTVVRPAQVTVSTGDGDGDESENGDR